MGLTIVWTDFAKNELRNIFQFYLYKVSFKIADKISEGIINHVKILSDQPKLGPIELSLEGRYREYRSLIYKNYKIIYWINTAKNRIDIIDVFDARQNPEQISRGV